MDESLLREILEEHSQNPYGDNERAGSSIKNERLDEMPPISTSQLTLEPVQTTE